jgi:membrane protein implicated in regulation of membrane protease activity
VPTWAFWAILAAALAAGEIFTLGFVLGPVALAAVAAAVVALFAPLWLQVIVFIVGSLASLGLIRPVATRHLRAPGVLRSGTAGLIGARALVLERVDANGGQVKIGGEIWTARAYMDDQVMEPGTRVDVLKIEGATALVSE